MNEISIKLLKNPYLSPLFTTLVMISQIPSTIHKQVKASNPMSCQKHCHSMSSNSWTDGHLLLATSKINLTTPYIPESHSSWSSMISQTVTATLLVYPPFHSISHLLPPKAFTRTSEISNCDQQTENLYYLYYSCSLTTFPPLLARWLEMSATDSQSVPSLLSPFMQTDWPL